MDVRNDVPEWAVELEEKRARREAIRKAENAEFYKFMNKVLRNVTIGFGLLYLLLAAMVFMR